MPLSNSQIISLLSARLADKNLNANNPYRDLSTENVLINAVLSLAGGIGAQSNTYIWIGDSLAGSGVTTSDAANLDVIPGAKIWYKPDRFSLDNGRWEDYDGLKNSYPGGAYGTATPRILGPQHTFLKRIIALTGKNARLIKFSIGGTSLLTQTGTFTDWKKTNLEIYNSLFTSFIPPALRSIPAGETTTIKCIIINLGTNDTLASIYTSSFGAEMKTFITDLRTDLNLPNLPVVLVKVRADLNAVGTATGTRTSASSVRADILNLINSGHGNYVTNLVLSEVDSYGVQADGIHITEAGTMQQGIDIADLVSLY